MLQVSMILLKRNWKLFETKNKQRENILLGKPIFLKF